MRIVLKDKNPILVAFSGHLGSGKDTVASIVFNALEGPSKHLSFAGPLRDEIQEVIDDINGSADKPRAYVTVAKQLNTTPAHARHAVDLLWDDVKNNGLKDSHERTDSTRLVLQYWGTEVRRAEDPDYWVKRAMKQARDVMSNGVSVYFTDARFPNEMDAVKAAGGATVRLLVSEQVQSDRILARDGERPTPEQLNHPSETAADDYDKFDMVIDTDDNDASIVAQMVAYGLTLTLPVDTIDNMLQ